MDDIFVEKIYIEDGREAERRVTEKPDMKITEILVEQPRPKVLAKRVIEKKQPMVIERETQTIDAQGQVTKRVVESLDLDEKMKVQDGDYSPVSRLELKEAMLSLATAIKAQEEKPMMAMAPAISAKEIIEDKILQAKKMPWERILWTIVGLECVGLGLIYWM